MSENNEQSVSDDNGKSIIVGDFIQITSEDTDLNDIWCIEYLSTEKMVVLKVDDAGNEKMNEFILEDGIIQDERVEKIELLDKPVIDDSPTDYEPASYLAYRHFSPNKWVEIMFSGLDEHIIGKILNVVDDSAEIVVFENGSLLSDAPIVLDFNYTGLPDGVLSINLIEDPTISIDGNEEKEQEEEYVVEDLNIQIAEEREFSKFRYGLEEQTNDILESMLSKLQSDKQIEKRTLASINQTIVRYTQLRELFSKFDEDHNIMHYYDNTEAVNKHGNNWKPLSTSLQMQDKQIGWVLPIAQHTKKIYKGLGDDIQYDDLVERRAETDRFEINTEYSQYADGKSAYSTFLNNISPNLIPFIDPDNEEHPFLTTPNTDMDVIVGNFNDKFSNAYGSNSIKQTPFQFSRYVSTIDYITQTNLTKMSYKTVFHPLIPADPLHVKALLTLPTTFMTHSRMRLPGTDMLGRANMALTFPSYSRILTMKTPVTSFISDNINAPILGDNFGDNHFKHYSYSGDQTITYSQFLDYFLPPTQTIIESKKNKLSHGHLSVVSIASELEPYLIYTDDLTLTHYNLISDHLQKNTKHFFTNLSGTSRAFNDLKRSNVYVSRYNGPTIVIENDISEATREEIPYYFSSGPIKSVIVNSEELSRTLMIDCGRIFSVCCAYNAIALSADVSNIQKDVIDPPIQEEDASVCISKIIAKKYKNMEKMQADNEVDIFFDAEYDVTDYAILNEPRISKKKFGLSADEFVSFLTNELTKLKISDIPTTVQSLLSGHRSVINGQYAILVDNYGERTLYKRENNKWELDPTAPKNAVDMELLCNSQPNCLTRKNKCESIEKARLGIEDSILSDRESNIGDKIKESIDSYKFKMENDFAYGLIHIKNARFPIELKTNYEKNMLGMDLKKYETVVSPYAKYVDPILSHPNFEKRQDLIIRFCDSPICREANEENEDKHWLYCTNTNVKLIPTFFVQLAHAHFQGNYHEVMNVVLNERKAIDDNGTVWIDKYSGYAIKHVDFDTDEGYNEDGFRVVSRAVLDVDEVDQELQMMSSEITDSVIIKSRMEYDKTGQVIYGIIDTLSRHMMIDMSITYNFIIKTTIKIYKSASMSEAEYKKTKNETPYATYLAQYLNYTTLAVFLIVCQTRTPTLVPKGTFPGCVKSFAGYPVGPIEDKSGIIYLLCILTKSKFIKVSSKPAFLEQYIDIAMQDASLRTLISKKRSVVEEMVPPKEHSISKWTSFQPVLVPFKLPPVLNVHEDFKELLLGNINSGKNAQYDKIAVLQSKIILFSYAIQSEIQKIVEAEPLILKSYDSKLLNENACCNGTTQMSTLDYFKSKNTNNNLEMFNNVIMEHRNILNGVDLISKPVMWLSDEKTKPSSIQIDAAFSINTIYSGVVKHCNFRTNVSNPDYITEICGEKPNIPIKITDTIEEIIGPLQQRGLTYSSEQLTKLLQAVSKIIVYSDNSQVSKTIMNDIIAFLNELDIKNEDSIIQKPFQTKMQECFTSDAASAMQELKHYTFNINTQIFQKIREFSRENRNKLFKPEHVDLLFLNRDRTQVYFQFLKNSIINIGKIFPSMCITQTSNYRAKLPNYWGVTDLHNKMLLDSYTKLFERVVSYYGEHATFFKYIVEESSKIIEMITKIPFADNEIGFLVLEHCLLLVIDIYMTVGENRIEDESLYESNFSSAAISTTQLNIMRDFIITIIGNDKHINVSYQAIVDATFRLKELEKNKLLRELNSTKDLAIDNHFKILRIGDRWGGGENVRGYDKKRSDKETIDFLGDAVVPQPQDGEDDQPTAMNDDGYDDPVDYANDYDNDGDE